MSDKFTFDQSSNEVPAAALRFDATAELGERNDDDAKTSPVRLRARSGDSIDHWYWGKIAHDHRGYELTGNKGRIALLYDHNEPVGYALRKNIGVGEDGALEVNGTLVQPRESAGPNRATQLVDQMSAGIPFEASISFAGGSPVIEKVPDGKSVEVNGQEFAGPGVVVRKWALREVSIVTSGADPDTESTLLNQSNTVSVSFTQQETEMSDDNKTAVEADQVVEELSEIAAVDTSDTDTVEAPAVDTEELQEASPKDETEATPTAKDFQEQFGRVQGSLYFADGLSMTDALSADNKRLQQELKDLQEKFADGEDEPTGFSQGGEMKSKVLTAIPGEVAEMTVRSK